MTRQDPVARFWSKVDKTGLCWMWNGGVSKTGYGAFGLWHGKPMKAHRFAYMIEFQEEIPRERTIDHLCQNKLCVNPYHLQVVTSRENIFRNPDSSASINLRKTHCPKGHPYSGDNLVVAGNSRGCRACRLVNKRNFRERRRAA